VAKTANGESPLVHGARPIPGCDVWEHSYYIDYRNRRPDYLQAFVDHLINWDYVLRCSLLHQNNNPKLKTAWRMGNGGQG
jgi:superoxide dismutase